MHTFQSFILAIHHRNWSELIVSKLIWLIWMSFVIRNDRWDINRMVDELANGLLHWAAAVVVGAKRF